MRKKNKPTACAALSKLNIIVLGLYCVEEKYSSFLFILVSTITPQYASIMAHVYKIFQVGFFFFFNIKQKFFNALCIAKVLLKTLRFVLKVKTFRLRLFHPFCLLYQLYL